MDSESNLTATQATNLEKLRKKYPMTIYRIIQDEVVIHLAGDEIGRFHASKLDNIRL